MIQNRDRHKDAIEIKATQRLDLYLVNKKARFRSTSRRVRQPHSPKQIWATFLQNHAKDIWACDFLQTFDLFFRSVFVFLIVELGSRRLVYFGVTRDPTDEWVAQQLRETTPKRCA